MSLQLRCLYTHSLALVVTTLLLTATSGTSGENNIAKNITAVLGHNVTFRCPSNHSKPIERLYIQKVIKDNEDVFINGFYTGHNVPVNEYMSRTNVNQMELSMEMRNVSVSDEGLYRCVVFYSSVDKTPTLINLQVTAEYSIPTITTDCSERKRSDGSSGMSCQLSCSAVGGYPQSAIRWLGLNQILTNAVYNWTSADNESKTWTINQTIVHHCDQPTNVSCAIGSAVSHTIPICETDSFPLEVIIAIVVVLVFVLLLIFVVVMKCCCRQSQNPEDPGEGAGVPLADCHSQLQHV